MLIAPIPAAKLYGIPVQADQKSYVLATGVRDLFMGLVFAVLSWSANLHLVGLVCFCLVPVAAVDFLLVRRFGRPHAFWVHLLGTIGLLVVGALLFYAGKS